MKRIYFHCRHTDRDVPLRLPYDGAKYVLAVDTKEHCPYCGAGGEDFKIAGNKRRPSKDNTAWVADGGCLACRAWLGDLVAETGTLFGVEEDERVSNMGVRIF